MNSLLGRPWARAATAVLTSTVAVGGVILFGAQEGNPAQDVKLLSGSAWLASGRAGQLTLLDGPSAEVAAQVQVAPAGDVLDVVQQGPNAYVVDKTAGTIRRLDGATFDVSQPESPVPGAGSGLTAFAGPKSLYVLDTRRGLFTSADPRTGRAQGAPKSLAQQLAPNSAGIDGAGRLWIIDNATGELAWVDGDEPHTKRDVAKPGRSILAIADGRPVIVDTTARRAMTFDPVMERVQDTMDLDLRPGEDVQVSGSPHSDRVYVVTPRGVLTICDLSEKDCAKTVPLTNADSKLGAAVEAGDRVFVPDYTTGQVWIVDLNNGSVLARPQVLTNAKQFQLLTRDNVVFYNDQDSEQAGVIRLDGTVQPTAKYDPKDPKKGLNSPITEANAPQQSQQSQQQAPPPPVQEPGTNQQQQQQNPTQQNPTAPGNTTAAVPPPSSSTAGGPSPSDDPPPHDPPQDQPPEKPVIKITPSKSSPIVNESITLKVDDAHGAAPASATWSFGDGQTGTGAMVSHKWTTVKAYQVSVQAKMADGQDATTSRTVDVTPVPDSKVPSVIGMTQAAASTAITNANLRVTVAQIASNTVAAGLVVAQNPAGNTIAPGQSIVTITVSTGKPAVIDLRARASSAAWRSGAGALPFDGSDVDEHGFVKPRSGLLLEDGSAPAFLETHPQWVANGFTEGTYTLPRAIIAGDHFRAKVGFIAVASPPSKGAGTFKVIVNGTTLAPVSDSGSDGVLRTIDVDLTRFAGATSLKLHVDAGSDSSQDWMSWVAPRIEG
jgi:hypothetical protein